MFSCVPKPSVLYVPEGDISHGVSELAHEIGVNTQPNVIIDLRQVRNFDMGVVTALTELAGGYAAKTNGGKITLIIDNTLKGLMGHPAYSEIFEILVGMEIQVRK